MPIKKIVLFLILIILSNLSYSQEYEGIPLKDNSRSNKETLVLFSYSTKNEIEYSPIEYLTYFLLKNDFKISSVFLRSVKTNGFNVLEFNFNYPNKNIIQKNEELKYKNNIPFKEESEKITWILATDNKDFLVSFGNRFLKKLYEKEGYFEEISFSLNEQTYILKITYSLTEALLERFFSQEESEEYKKLREDYFLPELKIIY